MFWTIVISLVIVACVALAIRSLVRSRKSGSPCSGCSGCAKGSASVSGAGAGGAGGAGGAANGIGAADKAKSEVGCDKCH